MARKKAQLEIVSRHGAPAAPPRPAPPTVSGRWILAALGIVVLAAAFCGWGTLCLLFWQGSWQLLYHPTSKVAQTPAAVGLAFEPVGFAATDTGTPQLHGWWIPAPPQSPFAQYTVLYLHGSTGNLGDTVHGLATLHAIGVNVFAFDYRGYGQSQFVRPSEAHWLQDTNSAIDYLTATRPIAPNSIVLDGHGLGANLALEVAAAHSDLAGVVLDTPLGSPLDAIFNDPRANLVPAHWLVHDSYAMQTPAENLRIPSLWLLARPVARQSAGGYDQISDAYYSVAAPKQALWLPAAQANSGDFTDTLSGWLTNLGSGQ
jgi:uncharacterized protein